MKIIRYQPESYKPVVLPISTCEGCKQDFPLSHTLQYGGLCHKCYHYYYYKVKSIITSIIYYPFS